MNVESKNILKYTVFEKVLPKTECIYRILNGQTAIGIIILQADYLKTVVADRYGFHWALLL